MSGFVSMKKWIVIIVVVAGAAVGWQQLRLLRTTGEAAATAGSVGTSTAIVETRDIQFSVKAAGDIGPAEQVSVRPEVNGKISDLLVLVLKN